MCQAEAEAVRRVAWVERTERQPAIYPPTIPLLHDVEGSMVLLVSVKHCSRSAPGAFAYGADLA